MGHHIAVIAVFKRSCSQKVYKKVVLKSLVKFKRKHQRWSFFFQKLAGVLQLFLKRDFSIDFRHAYPGLKEFVLYIKEVPLKRSLPLLSKILLIAWSSLYNQTTLGFT